MDACAITLLDETTGERFELACAFTQRQKDMLKAGGLLIQPLPGCPDEIIDQLELRSPMFADISREMTFAGLDQLCEDWFRGMEPRILERTPIAYRCTCSREEPWP